MKLLWVSNAPWAASGYGSQTRQVGRRLLTAGHEVEFSANDGTRGSTTWEGMLVRGSGSDRYSRDKVREDISRSGAFWTVVLYDPWAYTERSADPFDGLDRVVAWTPVDHFTVQPPSHEWLINHAAIAMSQFGYQRLLELAAVSKQAMGRTFPVRYAPHAIEPVFSPRDRTEFRAKAGIPQDAFLIGIVAANTGGAIYDRKGLSDMSRVASAFLDRRKDAWLYFHTLAQHPTGQGIPIPGMLGMFGTDASRVVFADQYAMQEQSLTDDDMASIYSSFDVLLATSRGEGFGLPVLEAQACGTPVIVSNGTAQPELVGAAWDPRSPQARRDPSGWVISVQPDYDARQMADYGIPNHYEAILALEDAYLNHRGEQEMRDAAVAQAGKWAADKVFEDHWKPILAEMAGGKLDPKKNADPSFPVEPMNREQRRAAKRGKKAA